MVDSDSNNEGQNTEISNFSFHGISSIGASSYSTSSVPVVEENPESESGIPR